jgi:hypothetical protein
VRGSGINENSIGIPACTLDATRLIDHAQLLQLVVADIDEELGEEGHMLVVL